MLKDMVTAKRMEAVKRETETVGGRKDREEDVRKTTEEM